jgi:hypothetical protein
MTTQASVKGQLIALEGTGGRSMAVATRRLERSLRHGGVSAGVSAWDASDIFFQIAGGARGIPAPPPRTLIHLYACDLAFRLRWQIRPALEEGTTVIAAPYVETAIAFGRGAGLPQSWLREIFSFASTPDVCYRVPESTIPVDRRGKPSDSFLEFCFAQLRNGPGHWETEEIRRGFHIHLESRSRCSVVPQLLTGLAATVG